MRRASLLGIGLLIGCGACGQTRDRATPDVRTVAPPADPRWVVTWAASPQEAAEPLKTSGQTLREIVHTSIGGDRVRVRVSNACGTLPLLIGAAHLAIRGQGASIAAGTDRVLTFGGSPSIYIPSGALVVSDPVALAVPELGDLAVSLFLPDPVILMTEHTGSEQTTYVTSRGDFTGAPLLVKPTTTRSWYLLSDVEVLAPAGSGAIVALGDSITDGYGSTLDTNRRWPDYLAERLKAAGGPRRLAVVNEGIAGNALLHEYIGTNALARLDGDVLALPGAKYVIVLEGINDIGGPTLRLKLLEEVRPDQIIGAYRQIIDRAHAQGLKVFGGTLLPFEGAKLDNYFTPGGEAKREVVNAWIRASGAYDGVIDFDRALRDPAHPTRLLPLYDSGDHLHPSDQGYEAMAVAVDLSLFGVGKP